MGLNITINGASYEDVPEMHAPLTDGSGMAKFYDTTERDAEESALITYANETTGAGDETISDCIETLVSGYGSGGSSGLGELVISEDFEIASDFTSTSLTNIYTLSSPLLANMDTNAEYLGIIKPSFEGSEQFIMLYGFFHVTNSGTVVALIGDGAYNWLVDRKTTSKGFSFTRSNYNPTLGKIMIQLRVDGSNLTIINAGTYNVSVYKLA